MTLRNLNLPAPKDSGMFENLCREIWTRELDDPYTQPYGRKGQKQDGVDLIGRCAATQDWVGIQCKVRSTGDLSKGDVDADVSRAKEVNPRLAKLIFATTAPRDTRLQEHARQLTDSHSKAGLFSVTVCFWEDLLEILAEDRYRDVLRRFFGAFVVEIEPSNMAIARVMRVRIGVAGESPDTAYELLIGKVPTASSEKQDGPPELAHWRGTYLIANLNGRTITTFRPPTHYSRFEGIFGTTRDALIIATWLGDPAHVERLLNGGTSDHVATITKREYAEFLRALRDD